MAARGYGAPVRFLPVSTSKVWSKEEQLVERREQFLLQELKVSQELEVSQGNLPKGTDGW